MKRTLQNCSVIKEMEVVPNQYDGKCEGFAGDTDETCEKCKECKLNVWYEEVSE